MERLLSDPGLQELSMAGVAAAAGVSEATLFRHFPNKEALLEAFRERAAAEFEVSPDLVERLDQVSNWIPHLFGYFKRNRQLLSAGRRLPDLLAYAESIRTARAARMRSLVAARYPELSPVQQASVSSVLHLVLSAQGWLWLLNSAGLGHASAVQTAQWAFDSLLERLDSGSAPDLKTSMDPSPPTPGG